VTGVTAWVEPASYSGPCPTPLTVTGTITVDEPGTVTYRWCHSPGSGVLESVTFNPGDPLTKTVSRSTHCGPSESWPCDWRELETETPNMKVAFVDLLPLKCQPIVTAVSTQVDPPSFSGDCPKTFHFTGTITTNGTSTVTYRWRHLPYVSEQKTIEFQGDSTASVEYDWTVGADLPADQRWLDLIVTSPNSIQAQPPARFELSCRVPVENLKAPLEAKRFVPRKRPGPPPVLQGAGGLESIQPGGEAIGPKGQGGGAKQGKHPAVGAIQGKGVASGAVSKPMVHLAQRTYNAPAKVVVGVSASAKQVVYLLQRQDAGGRWNTVQNLKAGGNPVFDVKTAGEYRVVAENSLGSATVAFQVVSNAVPKRAEPKASPHPIGSGASAGVKTAIKR